MSRIQFERRKRKKVLLVPVLIILALYFIIPIFLINKGSDLLDKSIKKIEQKDIVSPGIEFYNGMAFINTAASFPGFGKWSENIIESKVEKVIKLQDAEFTELCLSLLPNVKLIKDSVQYEVIIEQQNEAIKLKPAGQDSVYTIELNELTKNKIDSVYCKPWNEFFIKTKSDKTRLHTLCK